MYGTARLTSVASNITKNEWWARLASVALEYNKEWSIFTFVFLVGTGILTDVVEIIAFTPDCNERYLTESSRDGTMV